MKVYNVSEPIVNSYITLVNAGKRTIKEIPEKFQNEVATILDIPLKELTLEEEKELKIEELSNECEKLINAGTDIVLPSDGKMHHFSFTLTDQNNIKTCFDLATASKTEIPYHADNEVCRLFSVKDIVTLYAEEQYFITKTTTFFNYLRQQVKSLDTVDEVKATTFESTLNDELAVEYDKIIAYAGNVKDTIKASVMNDASNE